MVQSSIYTTHRNFVADIVFVPGTVNVDKRNPSDGRHTHFISCAEDGIVQFWDSRFVEKEFLKKNPDYIWKPYLRLEVFRMDGTGELGLSRLLLQKNQPNAQFWATSDEGELCLLDWSVRPAANQDDGPKITEYVKFVYESEKEYRPCLALERSKFFPNLILTVHDFHYAIWKIDMEDYQQPIFRSATSNN
jgi:hypothetical protein